MYNLIKHYIFYASLFYFFCLKNTVLPMQFENPIYMKEFVKNNAHEQYFQQLLERIEDPIVSLIMHNRVLEHARDCVVAPNFNQNVFRQFPEGCFKMAIRLTYSKNRP